MNYLRIYNEIIEKRKDNIPQKIYTEKHHIIPRCLGGSNAKKNLVKLTAREHYICHYLLWKMYKNTPKELSLLYAFMKMHCTNECHKKRYFNSKLYEKAKEIMGKGYSIKYKGKDNPNFGNIWIHHPDTFENKCVSLNVATQFFEQGWVKGRKFNTVLIYDKNNQPLKIQRKELLEYLQKGYHLSKSNLETYCRVFINLQTNEKVYLLPEQMEEYMNQGFISFKDYRIEKSNKIKKKRMKTESIKIHITFEDLVNACITKLDRLSEFKTLQEASDNLKFSKKVIREAFRRTTGKNDIRKGLKHKRPFKKHCKCVVCGKEFLASSHNIKYCSKKCADIYGIIHYQWISNGIEFKRVLPTDYFNIYKPLGFYCIKPTRTLPKEQWERISDTIYRKELISCREGFSQYQIDTNGNVYNKQGKILKASPNYKGYLIIQLKRDDGKICGLQVHRLIAEQFISNPENKEKITHIDGNRQNNCVENLQWVSASEASQLSFKKFNRKPSVVRKIYGKHIITGELIEFDSMAEAGRFVGCNRSCIQNVACGRKKSAKGYIWSYQPF